MRNANIRFLHFIVLLLAGYSLAYPADPAPLMRFPDIHENNVVFVSGEDIWKTTIDGGVATRLTLHDGEERFPKISPDGSLIAFCAEYDGNGDVYVMNMNGGNIRRVTFHPGYDVVVGWHPRKNKIIFRSSRLGYSRFLRLFMINPDGSGLETLILHEAAQGSFSADGNKIAFNKISRESRTWKRYKGGTAQEVYIYDLLTNQQKNITNFDGTDRLPMWIGDKIYFSSDRERVLNIFAYDTKTETIEKITNHTSFDVRRPSMGGRYIVYELGGDLYYLDTTTKETRRIPVTIESDAPELRPYLENVEDFITGIETSPGGQRALIVSRGEIFSVPKEHGSTVNLSRNGAARDKDAVWSPDGKTVAFFSDAEGEYQLYLTDSKGRQDKVRLTSHKDGYRHSLRWSPDSKKIAFTDQTLTLYFVELDSKKITKVDKAEYENIDVSLNLKPIYDYNWSPDSRFIAYSKMDQSLVNQVFIYSLESKIAHKVSEGHFNEFHPVFSQNGEHLFFISNRRFSPTLCDFEWEMVYKKMAGIYSMTLRKDGPALFPLRSDDEPISDPEEESTKPVRLKIDFEGISQRVEAFPLERGNYRYLAANENTLFYLNKDEGDFNRFEYRATGPKNLFAFSFDSREKNTVIEKIDSYKLSFDGSAIIYKKEGEVGLIESSARDSKGGALDLSGLTMQLDPMAEWKQIFNEAWRMERDFYYEPAMHGIDWTAMRDKYGALIDRATCRQDVRFIIGELIGELNTSHSYIYDGDTRREAETVNIGLLAADYSIDEKNQRYRFQKIYRITDWNQTNVPPLAVPGLNVNEGDYLLKVNNREVSSDRNIYSYFTGLAGRQVTLLVNSKPTLQGAREIRVKPVSSDRRFRYLNWLEKNRQIVDKASDGQIGYLHLPDTYTGSAAIFPKYYYSQTTKKALIVDGRYNAGGLDPDIFLQRLAKKPQSYWTRRYSNDQATPWLGNNAHMVCLTNRQAGSGGDELPYLFRQKGMGPVIGTRTWGGLVGVSMFIDLIDGGGLSAPDYRIYDLKGKWVVENEGVTPDIIIDLNSEEVSRGYDAQLMKGVEMLLQKIKENKRTWPKHEPFPVDR